MHTTSYHRYMKTRKQNILRIFLFKFIHSVTLNNSNGACDITWKTEAQFLKFLMQMETAGAQKNMDPWTEPVESVQEGGTGHKCLFERRDVQRMGSKAMYKVTLEAASFWDFEAAKRKKNSDYSQNLEVYNSHKTLHFKHLMQQTLFSQWTIEIDNFSRSRHTRGN